MHPNIFPIYSIFLLISVLVHVPRVLSKNDVHYVNCGIQVKCANMEISYPFWGGKRPSYCGYPKYELKCNGDAPELTMTDVSYRVLNISTSSQNVTVARADYWNDNCPDKYVNTTLDAALFNYTSTFPNLTLYYDCLSGVRRYSNSFTCSKTSSNNTSISTTSTTSSRSITYNASRANNSTSTNISHYYTVTGSDTMTVTCMDNVTIPIFQSVANDIETGLAGSISQAIAMNLLREALVGGFGLELIAINNSLCEGCVGSGGQCGYNATSSEFACFCPDMPYPSTCPNNTNTELCEACGASGGQCGYNWTSNEFTCNCSGIPYAFTCPNNTNTSLCDGCVASGGRCSYNQTVFSCLCRDMPHPSTCPKDLRTATGSNNVRRKIIIGISAGVVGCIIVFVMVGCFRMIKCSLAVKTLVFWKKETEDDQNVKAFIRNYGSLAPKRYNYSDIKRMTNSFTCKLGQGGFGCVYKGKLSDGRLVAVKLLSKSKGNGQEFINEVASISRTSQVNIVTLTGFCFERSRRALIYEFMPNGSLDKFIYNKGSSNENLNLEWKTMYQIAVGIARGLEYLYRGCNTRILHFDIKPHNILLDQNFIPKISDFGLAKLCQGTESMVSMTHARGTTGYIAPEVFCRNFGGASHKSDVYSYGMLVLEMVGGRKNIDVQVSHTSQIYFPSWIYKQLQPGKDLTLRSVTNEEEEETARKMVLVSLWCIQPNPSDRPSIDKVVEMLEGSSHLLEIPPNPFMCSPQNTP